MDKETAHQAIISRWPTVSAFADDLAQPYERVKKWWQRGYIPADYWTDCVEAARRRGLKCSLSELAGASRTAA